MSFFQACLLYIYLSAKLLFFYCCPNCNKRLGFFAAFLGIEHHCPRPPLRTTRHFFISQ